MSRSPERRAARALAAVPVAPVVVLLGLVVGGCSVTINGASGLSETEVEDSIAEEAGDKSGRPVEEIDCPGGLDPEVGATVTCSVVLAGVRSDWAVEVDEVDGSRINYGWEVVEGSQEIGSDALVEAIGDPFTE